MTSRAGRCRLFVALDASASARAVERRRVSVVLGDGSTVSVDDAAPVGGRNGNGTGLSAATAARFATPGLIDRLTVRVEVAGPAGLIWWRRSTEVVIDPLAVAPVAQGPSVTVECGGGAHSGWIDASGRRRRRSGAVVGDRSAARTPAASETVPERRSGILQREVALRVPAVETRQRSAPSRDGGRQRLRSRAWRC